MEESVTYQEILRKGKVQGILEERQEVLLDLGTEQFGPPPSELHTQLRAIRDLDRLQRMRKQLRHVNSWDELLTTP